MREPMRGTGLLLLALLFLAAAGLSATGTAEQPAAAEAEATAAGAGLPGADGDPDHPLQPGRRQRPVAARDGQVPRARR